MGAAIQAQCRVDPNPVDLLVGAGTGRSTLSVAGSLRVGRGPAGPRVWARALPSPDDTDLHVVWADAQGAGWVEGLPGAEPVEMASLGARSLVATVARAEFRGASLDAPEPLRGGLAGGCGVSLAARPGAVLAAGFRGTPGCTAGAPQVQRVDAEGSGIQPATALPFDAETTVRAMFARWDFGRFVVRATTSAGDEPLSWILDPDGEVLSTATGEVACAASGCVRVTVSAGDTGAEGQGMLRVEPLQHGEAWDTGVRAQDVSGVAVSGDRLLVLSASSHGAVGCSLTVLHLGRRSVLLEHHDDALSCDPGRVLATARGFVLAEQEAGRAARLRTLACEG